MVLFDPKNELHATFVAALSVMRAKVFNIPHPKDFRSGLARQSIAEDAAKIKVPDFKPSDEKAKSISQQVEKEQD